MNLKFKKPKIKTTVIIAGIVLIVLILPNLTQAQASIIGNIFGNLAADLLYLLMSFIFGVLGTFVRIGASIFEGMISVGFKSHLDVVKIGWGISRDFANMFFIVFMIIIAFATILRIEKYGIKQLLPKVIIIALLINFSMVICSVIIDFSNIGAHFFINDIKKYTDQGKGSIATVLTDSLNLTKSYSGIDCEGAYRSDMDTCSQLTDRWERQNCEATARAWHLSCQQAEQIPTSGGWARVLSLLISMTIGSLLLLIAAFALLAGGIMLLIRIVVVWFLVMIVPLVFLCYLMPGLRKQWQDWWSSFLRWCFFAPIYAFFIWIVFKIAVENKNRQIAAQIESAFGSFVDTGAGGNIFTSNPGQQLISYGFMIALLIGGLIAASKMGIYGAGTAMKVGQKAYKGAARWTGARVRERAAKPMEAVSARLAKTIGRVPGFKWLAKAPAAVMKAQRADIDKEKKNLGVHSMDTLKSLYPTFNKTQQIAAAQLMAEKGKLAKGGAFKDKDIEKIIKVTNTYGKDLANALLINRPDLAPTVGQTKKEAVERISPAKASNIQAEAFRDTQTMTLILQTFRGAHLDKIADASIKNANLIQDAIHDLDPTGTPATREAILKVMNPKLTVYINNAAMKGTGLYDFS